MTTKIYTCPVCHQDINYDENDNLLEVAVAHVPKCPKLVSSTPHKRITDVVPPEVFKGNFISMDELLDQEVLVKGMDWQASSFKEDAEYLTLTVEVDGEERKLATGAGRVMEVFRAVKITDLPIYCAFEKIQLPNGRRVYRVR